MKKILALILALVMVMALAACGGTNTPGTSEPTTTPSTQEPTTGPTTEPSTEATEPSTDPSTEPSTEPTEPSTDPTGPSDVTVMGEGATTFYFTVVDVDGTETNFQINTDATTVGDALLAVELIAGDESDWGLYVTTVNGITADYDNDSTYWSFYINGEYAMTGVSSTEVTAGATYSFVLTVDHYADATVLGEGATSFYFSVEDVDGTTSYFVIYTDATTVGEALLAVELIAGDESDWGLYVTTVNGITADYETESTYWSFYIDGEYAMTGVSSTEVTPYATYSFVKTVDHYANATVLGEGATSFYFSVEDVDGTTSYFVIYTDATTVGEALVALELISGDESDWGLYVTTVNGITADWDTEYSYWAFYIDGEYAMTGVDATEITPYATYSFIKTVEEPAPAE